jgi:hypothetical protein
MDKVRIKLSLQFDHPVNAYALVIGGYYPLSLTFSGMLLIDRNILSVLSSVSGLSTRQDGEANRWWLSFLNRPECILNPVLSALEGSERAVPSYEEFCASFDTACDYIREHLPNAQVVNFTQEAYQAAYATVEDLAARYENEQAFLSGVAPLLARKRKQVELREVEDSLFSLCSSSGLEVFSLPLIVALSCLYEPRQGNEQSIGRMIIKPNENYDEMRAHNTISDLRALEYLAVANGLGIGSVTFCTRDKALAALWCALKMEPGYWENGSVSVNMSLGAQLFPALSEEDINQLHQRMVERIF